MESWGRVFGETPDRAQFELWALMADGNLQFVSDAIVSTAKRDFSTGRKMSLDARLRFASGVIKIKSARRVKNDANRAAAQEELRKVRAVVVPPDRRPCKYCDAQSEAYSNTCPDHVDYQFKGRGNQ